MKRLKEIIKYINELDIVADIGCDHGYLLKLAIENRNIKKVMQLIIKLVHLIVQNKI